MEDQMEVDFPPGTVRLERLLDRKHGEIILHPIPSSDPNDPLNWSQWYKALHYGLVSFYVLIVFINVDIGSVIWGDLNTDLGISFASMSASFGVNCAGLALGCVLFIPFALKFGRRSIYLVSIAVSMATAIWQGRLQTTGDLIGANFVAGLAGSIAEAICQMTIADVFFVHQRATCNGIYLLMTTTGSFLAPVAAGYSAQSQGFRWIWWWTTILCGICLLAFVFLYEDSKYSPIDVGQAPAATEERVNSISANDGKISDDKMAQLGISTTSTSRHFDSAIKRKTYLQRLALFQPGAFDGDWRLVLRHTYQPFYILFTFPAIAFTALMYGSVLAWFSVIVNVYSTYYTYPPYNFGSVGIGLMNLPPFIGSVLGSLYGGLFNDWLTVRLARRNNGIFEPEMVLWVAVPAVFTLPASLLLFGLPTAYGMPWIVACIGSAMFGFSMTALWDAALTYAMDCYADIIGDAMISVCFVRNVCATIVAVCFSYWVEGMGLVGLHVLSAVLAFVTAATTFPMIVWGKAARRWTEKRLVKMTARQFGGRG
ncbi:uncharacterized protein LTR77_008699 [Saxophila tyrrhenica]|uniref:Major facilitator superfamily (MFS) profile domain-containing protein n=1 Tax=Saxophila tyrrhenica TaxID=1690608 RepID=A0AAV9P3Q1_9PEZI|nr:hypothetical protein LTR77_008699 [Saxophila tyrrhenica]